MKPQRPRLIAFSIDAEILNLPVSVVVEALPLKRESSRASAGAHAMSNARNATAVRINPGDTKWIELGRFNDNEYRGRDGHY